MIFKNNNEITRVLIFIIIYYFLSLLIYDIYFECICNKLNINKNRILLIFYIKFTNYCKIIYL